MQSVIKEFWGAFIKPWKEPSFTLYFIFMVVGFGGIGIFLSIYQHWYYNQQINECSNAVDKITESAIAQSIMTYAIAILVPAALSIFLHLIIPKAKYKISHSIITITTLLVVILLVCFTFIKGSMYIAGIATIIAWIFWIVANSENDSLKDGSYNSMIKKEVKKHGQGWN